MWCVKFGENRCCMYVGSWPDCDLQGDNYGYICLENPPHNRRKQVWPVSGLPPLFCMKLRCRSAMLFCCIYILLKYVLRMCDRVTMLRGRSVFCNQGSYLKPVILRMQFSEVSQFLNISLLIIFLHKNLCDLLVKYVICPPFPVFSYLLELIVHWSSWCMKYI
jgi:hypothetical protein